MGVRKSSITDLYVWLNGIPVAIWSHKRGQSQLQYFDEWLEAPEARPLSLSLPFAPGNLARTDPEVTSYFDNLLPDSEPIRRRLAQRHGTYNTSPFELLASLGRDCVGAVQLLPPGEAPEDLFSIKKEPLSEAKVAQLLRNITAPAVPGQTGEDEADLRLSIAGAQEKTALLWQDGNWHKPLGSTPTTHILKLPLGLAGNMRASLQSVENEWLCLEIFREFGLKVPRSAVLTFEDQKVLAVERFDRKYAEDGSWIMRLPQEDMCQATGTPPNLKYQSDGGPGIERIMKILLGSDSAYEDRHAFFMAQILFWLLKATDGHAKNFSIFLLRNAEYKATPFYDILSAHPVLGKGPEQISPKKARMAMAVRGSENYYHFDRIRRSHWSKMGRAVGLGYDAVETLIGTILGRAPAVIDRIYAGLPDDFPAALAESILEGMRDQCAAMEAQDPRA